MRIVKTKGLAVSLAVYEIFQDLVNNSDEDFGRLVSVFIGTFTNCRECGLTYICCANNGKDFTFCTYEHRNSDSIIINGKEGFISMNGDLPYSGGTKWDYIKSFSYNEYYKCAEELLKLIKEFLRNNMEKVEE